MALTYALLWVIMVVSGGGIMALASGSMSPGEPLGAALEPGRAARVMDVIMGSARWSGVSIMITAAACGSLALVAAAVGRVPWPRRLGIGGVWPRPGAWVGGVLVALGLSQGASMLLAWSGVELRGTLLQMRVAVRDADAVGLGMVAFAVCVAAPLGEELFFRGYLQRPLVQRWGAVTGIVVASAAFGLVHGDALHAPMAALLGLSLGWLAERGRTVWLAVAAHAAVNTVWLILARLSPEVTPGEPSVTMTLASVVALAVGIHLVRSRCRPECLSVDPAETDG